MSFAARMTGIGSAFPPTRMTNAQLCERIESTDEWIRERTGIAERRVFDPKNKEEHNSALGARAALQALEMAGKKPEDIDGILYATCTPDTVVPSTACWLQNHIGAKRAWAMDLNAACSGFVFGAALANSQIIAGAAKTILVVGTDLTTSFLDWDDRNSSILFGDGSGAAIIERCDANEPRRILSTHMGSDGTLWELLYMPAGGSSMEVTPEAYAQKLHKMRMKGKEIFKVAVKTLADYAIEALETNNVKLSDVDWFVPHQANLRIIEAVAKRLEFPMEKVLINIDRFANTSAATVPTVLDEAVRDGRVKPGQLILMDVFGAGLTYGSLLMRW